jgi:Domain of unknown function (DUF6896)
MNALTAIVRRSRALYKSVDVPIMQGDLPFLVDRFLKMIEAFQRQTARANALLQEFLHLVNPMYWRQGGISRTGYCGPGNSIHYYYHGSGCTVESDDLLIDWDYGLDGRVDGFDLWRLWRFAEESTNSFPEFRDEEVLEGVFQEAIKRKLIHQPFLAKQDDLYYLRDVS